MGQESSILQGKPLSTAQQRFWVLEQLHPEGGMQNISLGLRSSTAMDPTKIEATLRDVTAQHEILRARFRSVDGTPVQFFDSSSVAKLHTIDLSGTPDQERQAELDKLVGNEITTRFDLGRDLPFRGTLFQLGQGGSVLLLVVHRIVCDRVSLKEILREVHTRYEARPAGVPQNSIGSRQYREITLDHFEDPVGLSYWRQQLSGAPATLDLPTDRQRPALQTFSGASQKVLIEASAADRIRNLAHDSGATLFETILATYAVLLHRYSRQEDLVIGTRVSGRSRPGFVGIVGPLQNFLALRIGVSGDMSFNQLLTRVHEVSEGASAHESVPFESVVRELHLDRDMSRHPVFQIGFSMLEKGATDFELGSGVSIFEPETEREELDVSADVLDTGNHIEIRFGYSTDLFDPATINRMMSHFQCLLESAVNDPGVQISRLKMLSEIEKHQILLDWNDTEIPFPASDCLHQFFEEQVEKTPDARAVVHRDQSLSYRELNKRANCVAHYLRRHGVGPEALVGICVERSLQMIVGILGILKAGGAYVPLDPAYPRDRLAVILADAKPAIILTQAKLVEILPQDKGKIARLDADWPLIAQEPASNPVRNVKPGNLDYVLFTSGSTGRPKGVALEHRSAVIFVHWAKQVFLQEEVAGTLLSTSICFDLSVFEIFVPLSMGGSVIIAENALELPNLTSRDDVTLINTVPSAIAALIRMGGVPRSVRVVNLAGEALLSSLARQIYQETSIRKLYNLYGPTEDTTYSTYTLVPREGSVTIGKPLRNTQAYILDERQQPVPIGVAGELYLAGDGLARGYYGRQDLTNERFVANPFARKAGARMYKTGDLARFRSDGEIEYLGRIDNQVKIRGFRIELGEIETVLSRDASVDSAVVVAREDDPGEKRLVAYVVPSGQSVSVAHLQEVLRQRLPEYMVPSAFVELKELPLTPNGKINRQVLPAPEPVVVNGRGVTKANNELEAILVEIWQKVLGIRTVGIRDDFFDLGGHSLSAAHVLAEVERLTQRKLPLSALFRGGTIESLARLISESSDAAEHVVLEIQQGSARRLPFFAIVPPGEESIGYAMLARHMGPEQTVYKVQGQSPVTRSKRPYTEQELAALSDEYVAAMRSVQPSGPYCLGGLCDGTQIAEQVVLKLEAQGEEVGFFAIFDTWVLQHSQNRLLWKVHYYRQRLREMKEMSFSKRLASYRRVAENKIQNLVGSKPARVDWRQAYWPEGFTAPRFRAPVVLFKRPKQPFYYVNDPQMGWGARSGGGVEIHEVDFSHAEILREPQVGVFGKKLADYVARIRRGAVDRDGSLVTAGPGRRIS